MTKRLIIAFLFFVLAAVKLVYWFVFFNKYRPNFAANDYIGFRNSYTENFPEFLQGMYAYSSNWPGIIGMALSGIAGAIFIEAFLKRKNRFYMLMAALCAFIGLCNLWGLL